MSHWQTDRNCQSKSLWNQKLMRTKLTIIYIYIFWKQKRKCPCYLCLQKTTTKRFMQLQYCYYSNHGNSPNLDDENMRWWHTMYISPGWNSMKTLDLLLKIFDNQFPRLFFVTMYNCCLSRFLEHFAKNASHFYNRQKWFTPIMLKMSKNCSFSKNSTPKQLPLQLRSPKVGLMSEWPWPWKVVGWHTFPCVQNWGLNEVP